MLLFIAEEKYISNNYSISKNQQRDFIRFLVDLAMEKPYLPYIWIIKQKIKYSQIYEQTYNDLVISKPTRN